MQKHVATHSPIQSRKQDFLPDTTPLSAIALIESVLNEAYQCNASDLHVSPEQEYISVRIRLDGFLQEIRRLPRISHPALLARVKILAGLRTDEHFSAQDGRFRFPISDSILCDVRVSIAPTYHGEKMVLRILKHDTQSQTLQGLGLRNSHQSIVGRALEHPYGMILVTGPTGSGKTTLLYSLLQMLDRDARSIVTLEDPIEYSLPGVSQIPVNGSRGLSFANGLRTVLRQDPDIIMVGEIRDTETARLAINAALTGHLLLSTLHTNDAVSTLPRLIEMGIEPYLLAATLHLIVAQRLVRRICADCKEPYIPKEAQLARIRAIATESMSADSAFMLGKGCDACRGTGYRGRVGIYETLIVDEVIREAIQDRASINTLQEIARARGMLLLSQDGLKKVHKGVTSLDELLRVSYV